MMSAWKNMVPAAGVFNWKELDALNLYVFGIYWFILYVFGIYKKIKFLQMGGKIVEFMYSLNILGMD
jgi:hypothetical protein